ncbi:MAG: putative rane protein, partial [Phycisphaerales bacterium]|nr:putative rane protein [Phycisphaerales bacterium]
NPPAAAGVDADRRDLVAVLLPLAEQSGLPLALQARVAAYAAGRVRPTHHLDEPATVAARNRAADAVTMAAAARQVEPNEILVSKAKGFLDDGDVSVLREENRWYVETLKGSSWKPAAGTAAAALVVTVVLAAYVVAFQPRAAKNPYRGLAIAALLLSMLLVAALAGAANYPVYLFGTAPTLLVAMILAIAYDRRFAVGVATLHAVLVTIALAQSAPFLLVLGAGVLTAGLLLDDVRTRSKLVEVGGAAAIAMMFATAAAGLLAVDSGQFVFRNCCYAGAAGLAVGFVVLGILPFVERAFRITTSMTLLELADASQPLLRRLQVEAPGTYNHSLQVANLSESAAEAVGADSLLCRVGSYYHDVGKINKPDYFVENQAGGQNRHLNLDPNLSLHIIVGHVKDGVELAREYNLPTSLVPIIQQHHGTTVVEYFYRRAVSRRQEQIEAALCAAQGAGAKPPAVSESQFRYEGPRPRTKEVAIIMLADAVESATRSLSDPTAAQIEGLVNDLAMKRLLDKQFDECDLTLKELDAIKRSLVRTLAGIYHGRIPYPGQATPQPAGPAPTDTIQGNVPSSQQQPRTGTA